MRDSSGRISRSAPASLAGRLNGANLTKHGCCGPVWYPAVATYGRDDELARQARSLTDKWLSTRQGIEPSLIASILKTAAYTGDTALAERFVTIWPTLDPQHQDSLLQ